jgi:hypothetical protein
MVHPPPHRRPRMTTCPAPRESPAPREPPPLRPCAAPESSAAPGHAAPQESTPIAAERPMCHANKNITYIK